MPVQAGDGSDNAELKSLSLYQSADVYEGLTPVIIDFKPSIEDLGESRGNIEPLKMDRFLMIIDIFMITCISPLVLKIML